jgi:DNA-binding CsgD family transcriptional regulator/DNA-binding winged helix-turn-helix (wHTH) protein
MNNLIKYYFLNFLTERECQILLFAVEGLMAKEVAQRLRTSIPDIEQSWRIMRAKMGANTKSHAVALFIQASRDFFSGIELRPDADKIWNDYVINEVGIREKMNSDVDTTSQLNISRLDLNKQNQGLFRYDAKRMSFYYKDELIYLSKTPFLLLKYLYEHVGEVCSYEDCIKAVYDVDTISIRSDLWYEKARLNRNFVIIRACLEKVHPDARDIVKNRRGIGYILDI